MQRAIKTGLQTGMFLQEIRTANSNEFPAGLSNTRTVAWWACLHPVLLSAGLETMNRGLCEDMSPLLHSWWKQNWELLAQSSTQAELQGFPDICTLTSAPTDLQVVRNGHMWCICVFACSSAFFCWHERLCWSSSLSKQAQLLFQGYRLPNTLTPCCRLLLAD